LHASALRFFLKEMSMQKEEQASAIPIAGASKKFYLKSIIIISQNISVPAPNTSMPIITQVRGEIPLELVCFSIIFLLPSV
jgi:hypothetical protein